MVEQQALILHLHPTPSIEPGYYEDGSFGIRIENLVQIIETTTPYRFKDVQYLTMETITFVPIQQKMILPELITTEEVIRMCTSMQICSTVCKSLKCTCCVSSDPKSVYKLLSNTFVTSVLEYSYTRQ